MNTANMIFHSFKIVSFMVVAKVNVLKKNQLIKDKLSMSLLLQNVPQNIVEEFLKMCVKVF